MAIVVREANLIDDGAVLRNLAKRYLDRAADERRFQWLYQDNPFGPARAWIAYADKDKPVGMAAMFPRHMYSAGNVVHGCVLGDLCMDPEYRSLGPALKVQRACMASAQSGNLALAYDFPSAAMAGIYKHLGLEPVSTSIRQVKLLRAETFARGLGVSMPGPVAAVVNFALAVGDQRSAASTNLEFSMQDEECTSEFSAIAEEVGSSCGACTVRSAEYLNWRYRHHPRVRYEFLTARRHGKLVAYCTFTQSGRDTIIAELFGDIKDEALMAALLRQLAVLLRARGISAINLPLLSNDPRNQWLRKLGFWARERVPVICFGRETDDDASQMLLMHGDRES